MQSMDNSLRFFSTPGRMTSPGGHAHLLTRLPDDIPALCSVVQGLMVHIFWAGQHGLELTKARRDEVQLRPVSHKLERIIEIDPRPLTEVRPPEKRLVGNCRDFSVLMTTLLRHRGIPARARCGFGRYFTAGHHEDHWVVEYWNADLKKWILVDAQLDELQRGKLSISFNPFDVPREQFVVAGKAWQLCRSGQANPDTFGILDMKGLWFVRGNVVRDLAALNKMELLPWDSWSIMQGRDEDLPARDLTLLDQVAELTARDVPNFVRAQDLYENDDRLRVPRIITSYTQDGPRSIDLSEL